MESYDNSYTTYYENGVLNTTVPLVNGKKHGIYKKFYENG